MKQGRYSLMVWVIGCVLMFAATFYSHTWRNEGSNATIVWDPMGYYLYLPSIAYDDLGKLEKLPHILDIYHPSDIFYQAVMQPNGHYVMKYSSGMAVMYIPGFVAGHVWAKAFGYPVDGFSRPYQIAMNFWSIAVAFIGLWFCRKILLRYFSDITTAAALAILVVATNYSFYVYLGGMSAHNYLFTIYSLVIYCTIRWYEKPSYRYSVALGLLCGLATLTRPTEIICVFIPLLWGITSVAGIKQRLQLFSQSISKLLVFALMAALVGAIQLIYWKTYAGHWLYYSYEEQGFSWLKPHVINCLFSYKKGWFMYTPVMIFSIIGFIPLYRNHRQLFWASLAFTLVALYITFAWDIWWYSAFTFRAVIQFYAILVLPLAAFIEVAFHSRFKFAVIVAFIFCGCLNVLMDWQAHNGIMETEEMTCAYYWRIFGPTSITLNDKKLMDDPDEMPRRLDNSLTLISMFNFDKWTSPTTFPVDTMIRVQVLDKNHHKTSEIKVPLQPTNKGWVRLYARLYYQQKEYDMWSQTELKIALYSNGKEVKTRSIRAQRITEGNNWYEIYFDAHIPSKYTVDYLSIYCQQKSSLPVWISEYKVYFTPLD